MKLDARLVHQQLKSKADTIDLHGGVYLSKSGHIDLYATVKVDYLLKNRVHSFSFWKDWCLRANIDSENIAHYPVRYLVPDLLKNHRDVFIYFPHNGQKDFGEQIFGLEFIDTTETIFQKIIQPCINEIFNSSNDLKKLLLEPAPYVYMGALLHEGLHQIGPWKMVPKPSENIKLSGFQLSCWGELAADTRIGSITPECYLPFLAHVFLKIFWYGRFEKADNDSWGGHAMLLFALESGLISKDGNKWSLEMKYINDYISSLESFLSNANPDESSNVTDESVKLVWEKQISSFGHETNKMFKEIYKRCEIHPTFV